MKRWNKFITSLALDQRVDFEEGDIGLAGGIKSYEPALAHPVTQEPEPKRWGWCELSCESFFLDLWVSAGRVFWGCFATFCTYLLANSAQAWWLVRFWQDQIIRFGGDTDPSLPWPVHHQGSNENSSMEKPLGNWWSVGCRDGFMVKYLGKDSATRQLDSHVLCWQDWNRNTMEY